jgi:hypothetical protein
MSHRLVLAWVVAGLLLGGGVGAGEHLKRPASTADTDRATIAHADERAAESADAAITKGADGLAEVCSNDGMMTNATLDLLEPRGDDPITQFFRAWRRHDSPASHKAVRSRCVRSISSAAHTLSTW